MHIPPALLQKGPPPMVHHKGPPVSGLGSEIPGMVKLLIWQASSSQHSWTLLGLFLVQEIPAIQCHASAPKHRRYCLWHQVEQNDTFITTYCLFSNQGAVIARKQLLVSIQCLWTTKGTATCQMLQVWHNWNLILKISYYATYSRVHVFSWEVVVVVVV